MSADAATNPVVDPGPSLADSLGRVVVGPRRDLVVTRQVVRNEAQYVIHDPVAFRNQALAALEYRIFCSLGSGLTLTESFENLVAEDVLASEDREEFFEFVLGLHGLGLLVVPGMSSDVAWRRHEEGQKARRRGKLRCLISLRVPFGSPDRWLAKITPYLSWLYAKPGLVLWLGLLVAAAWQCGGRLAELFGGAAELLELQNLPIMWCALIALKALHELGHAIALKSFGGVVPDCGVIFIFLTPCAYVDANASWTFPKRWQRVVVGLGGMYVETMIAFVFALIWAGTQPGLLHSIAQSVVILATVTTVFINSNPLIKFDGYYIFSDLAGVINLQERASRNLRANAERKLLGVAREREHVVGLERVLVWLYAPASLAYRISLAFGITAVMLTTWPTIGVPLGLAFAWMLILDPLQRMYRYLWNSDRLETVRLRARVVAVLSVLFVAILFTLLPVSHSVVVPGVLDPGVKRYVRAPSSAFVEDITVSEGDVVAGGSRLAVLRDPVLEERIADVRSELKTARVQYDVSEITDPNFATTLSARIEFLEERAAELETRAAALELAVPAAADHGTVVGVRQVVPGEFLRQGDEILQVHSDHRFVRVVLTDKEFGRTRLVIGADAVLRFSCQPDVEIAATVCEVRRSASRWRVPVELTVAAGGEIFARSIGDEIEADQPYLHVFMQADAVPFEAAGTGLTAQVRFGARTETLGGWLKKSFLSFLYNWRST